MQGMLDIDNGAKKSEEDFQKASAFKLAQISTFSSVLSDVLEKRGQIDLLTKIEIPVSGTLFAMECAGAAIDRQKLLAFRERFGSDADQASRIAFDAAGYEFNLQSPKQLQKVLFEDFGLTGTRKTKTGYTTDATALQELYIRSVHNERANTFLGALLQFREMNKLKQIAQTLIDSVNPTDSRIHTTFEQTVAGTGRLSSTDPNLQNIPNRNAVGREIREVFRAGDGFANLLSSDYSQVELRIMAHLSGDEALIEAFKSGVDFHKYVASLVYQIPVDEVSGDQRSHVKAMSYGLAYGLSTFGLAQRLEISPAEADVLRDKYFETFGKVHDYLESLQSQAARRGYTETMFGRRRYFPGFRSSIRRVKDAAQRAALNAPIQGSAADIMKIAMVKAHEALCEAGVKSRIILQIHDELVVELAAGEEERVTAIVKNAMEHAVELSVPLDVSTGIGVDWQAAAH
jgi:DNA polymerase-1